MDLIYQKKNRYLWSLLSFQSGFANLGGMLAVHHYVSHVTGFAGHIAINIHSQSYKNAFLLLAIPIAFLTGATYSAYFSDIKRLKNQTPRYDFVLFSIAMIYLLVTIAGYKNYFGFFGEDLINTRDYFLMMLLCFASGAQNALITTYSGAVVRTTHLTGLVTDLGIGLARVASQNHHEHEKKSNLLRLEIIASFTIGGVIGVFCFHKVHFWGFIIPAIISFVISMRFFRQNK